MRDDIPELGPGYKSPWEPKTAHAGGNGYTYGPDFEVIPAQTFRVQPSRSDTRCPICGKPVDVRGEHAVVEERFDGRLVGGRYAHSGCVVTDEKASDQSRPLRPKSAT